MANEDIDIIGTGAGKGASPPPTPPPPPPPPPKPSKDESESGGFMGGLRVSLMPSAEGDEAASELRRKLVILFAVLIVETIIIGGAFLFVSNKEAEALAARQEMEDTLNRVTKDIKDSEKGTTEMTTFDARVRGATDILENHLYWTSLFNYIKDVTKPSVQYLDFTGNAVSGVITLDAMAPTYRDVAEQIVALMDNPMISEVISSSASATVDEVGTLIGVSFSLILKIDYEVWKNASNAGIAGEDMLDGTEVLEAGLEDIMPFGLEEDDVMTEGDTGE